MSELKATPGPWSVEECPAGGAILRRNSKQSHLQVFPEADARLIAAAPDLYAALIERDGGAHDKDCKALRDWGSYVCTCGHDHAQAALAKARGEEV
jgi:hypothetical protein